MSLFRMLETSASAMRAERQRAEVVTANMANAETTRTEQGGPYQRKLVVFRTGGERFPLMLAAWQPAERLQGVRVTQVVSDPTPPLQRYEPGHPDADSRGYVSYPAIDPVTEMADLLGAVRAYEMNASAVQSAKAMIQQSLDILR